MSKPSVDGKIAHSGPVALTADRPSHSGVVSAISRYWAASLGLLLAIAALLPLAMGAVIGRQPAVCPCCGQELNLPVVVEADTAGGVDRDLLGRSRSGVQQVFYLAASCPRCLYSGYPRDFLPPGSRAPSLTLAQRERVAKAVAPLRDKLGTVTPQTDILRISGEHRLELTYAVAEAMGRSDEALGWTALRRAWCARLSARLPERPRYKFMIDRLAAAVPAPADGNQADRGLLMASLAVNARVVDGESPADRLFRRAAGAYLLRRHGELQRFEQARKDILAEAMQLRREMLGAPAGAQATQPAGALTTQPAIAQNTQVASTVRMATTQPLASTRPAHTRPAEQAGSANAAESDQHLPESVAATDVLAQTLDAIEADLAGWSLHVADERLWLDRAASHFERALTSSTISTVDKSSTSSTAGIAGATPTRVNAGGVRQASTQPAAQAASRASDSTLALGSQNRAAAMYLLGEIYRRLGRVPEARSWFSRVDEASLPNDLRRWLREQQRQLER